MKIAFALPALLAVLTAPLTAQDASGHQHTDGMKHEGSVESPTTTAPPATLKQGGQAAYATLSETVRLLTADPNTDWSKVNIEALRQHLIDMDNVTMRSVVKTTEVPGGLSMDVTGAGETAKAIQRMSVSHGKQLDLMPAYHAVVTPITNGARIMVTARNNDAATTQRIRALSFAGLLTEGDHHAAHHQMLARGEAVHQH
ncbi:MAG: hypothetical protein V4558_11675 [Gemmatimonadota bacterium]